MAHNQSRTHTTIPRHHVHYYTALKSHAAQHSSHLDVLDFVVGPLAKATVGEDHQHGREDDHDGTYARLYTRARAHVASGWQVYETLAP